MILEVKNLTMKFGQFIACDNLCFDVGEGEIFGIAGPNGAGKTTLFNCISGVYHGTGEIIFDNKKINGLTPDRVCRSGIARTFQIPKIFTSMTIQENLWVGANFGSNLVIEKLRIALIEDILDQLGLTSKKNYIGENLSLYDRKLTMLGAALSTKPKMILLDEPVGGLSIEEIDDFIRILKKLNENKGLTIIIIEHLMRVLTGISNRLMILENGRKVTIGDPLEVCKDEKIIEIYLGKGKVVC